MGFQEFAQSLKISHLWFPKPIQKNLYSGSSVTVYTPHHPDRRNGQLQAALYTRWLQKTTFSADLPVVPGYSSIRHSLPHPKRLPCSSYQTCYHFSPAFKILEVGVNYLPTLSVPPKLQKMPTEISGWSRGSSLPSFTLGEEKTSPAFPVRGGAEIHITAFLSTLSQPPLSEPCVLLIIF